MRYLQRLIVSLVLALSVATVATFSTGCMSSQVAASKDPQAIAFASLWDAWSTVDAAMKIYGVQVREGKVSAERQAEIDAAHAKFQAAVNTGIQAAQFDWKSAPPAEIAAMATSIINLVTQL
jgi:hypothetical protein